MTASIQDFRRKVFSAQPDYDEPRVRRESARRVPPRMPLLASFQAAAALVAAAASLTGQAPRLTFQFQTVARTGDVAPGSSGARFDRFGLPPGIGGVLRPAIDDGGRIAFHAYLGDGNPATPTAIEGIFKEGPALVAVFGDPAPGTNETFTGFPSPLGPVAPRIHAGRVTLVGQLSGSTPGKGGIWSERFGTLARVLHTNDTLPDTPAGSTVFELAHALRGTAIVVNVRYALAGAGGVGTDTEGLWIDANGAFQTIAAKGVPAPGTAPGVVFDAGTSHAFFGPIDGWDANRVGQAVFAGYLGGPGIDILNDEGIWVGAPGSLALLVREGQSVPGQPGVRFGSPGGFRTFGTAGEVLSPTLNDRGTVLFGAVLNGPGSDHVVPAFLAQNGRIRILARASSSLPGTPPGDPAAGYPAPFTYASFLGGIVNNSDDVVLVGFATTGDPFSQAPAIWRDRGNGLELVAGAGRPVAAVPGQTFTSVATAGFGDLGLLYYTGTMSGPGTSPANDGVLFAMDVHGQHEIVLREGDPFVVGLNDTRTIAAIVAGTGVADAGATAVTLTFTDGSIAIVKAEPDLALIADTRLLSAASGGTVLFQLFAGSPRAGRPYFLAGSASGIHPGIDLGGGLVLPLNLDGFLLATLSGGPQFAGFLGVLDPQGRTAAKLSTFGPLPPELVGAGLHFAYVVANPLDFVSNQVPLTVVR